LIDDKILARLDALLRQADDMERDKATREGCSLLGGGTLYFVDEEASIEWVSSCRHLISKVAGANSDYHAALQTFDPGYFSSLVRARGVLRAVRNDYAAGLFADFKELAAAEVFDDFLEMADHLCQHKYWAPAASLAGAVLEDSLRKLHTKKLGPWTGESRISKLNQALHKAGVYTQADWRQIDTWGDIRNAVDHHDFEKVDEATVEREVPSMIGWVQDFIRRHLT